MLGGLGLTGGFLRLASWRLAVGVAGWRIGREN